MESILDFYVIFPFMDMVYILLASNYVSILIVMELKLKPINKDLFLIMTIP